MMCAQAGTAGHQPTHQPALNHAAGRRLRLARSTGRQFQGVEVEASSKKAVGIAHSTTQHGVGIRSEGWRRVRLEGWSSMHPPGYGRKQRSRREAWVTQAGSRPPIVSCLAGLAG